MRIKKHYSKRYSGTLFFFPAFLPLAALLPWLLTALGAVAAAASFSLPVFWRRYRLPVLGVAVLCVAAGGGVYVYHRPAQEVIDHGTRVVAVPDAPVEHAATTVPVPAAAYEYFKKIWHIPVDKQILATPVIYGGLLIYGTYNGSVEAIARDNGAPAWTVPVKNPVFALTRGADGIVYAGEGLHDTTAASLTALRAENGRALWAREFLGHLEEKVALNPAQNRLWVSAGPGGLWTLDSRDGAVLWHKPLGHIDARALARDDVVYIPANLDEKNDKTVFYALNATNGDVLWSLPQPGKPWGSPVMDRSGKIILTTTGNGQIGVEKETDKGWAQGIATDGTLLWQVELPGMTLQPASYLAESDIVIYTAKNGHITALNARDGGVVWQEKAAREFQSPAVLISGFKVPMVAAVDFDGKFSIRNALTGVVLREETVGELSTSSPAVDGDIIYVPAAYSITAFGGLRALAEGL